MIFLGFIFISCSLLIASIGEIFEARLADTIHDKYIVKNPKTMLKITTDIGILNINSISVENALLPINIVVIFININVAKIPTRIPIGIEINPNNIPSNKTLLLICFFVAPILDSIPYCFIFSVIDIAKLLRITNTLVTIIIPIIIPAKEYSIVVVLSDLETPDHLSNSSFT